MGDKMDAHKCKNPTIRSHLDPAISRLIQVPQKLQIFLESHFKRPQRDENAKDLAGLRARRERKSLADWEANLNKQMQLWKENPLWSGLQPVVEVKVPKGTLCNLSVRFDVGLPPDAVYNIVIDPDNKRVFKNIKEVISRKVLFDDGLRQVVELDQAAIWRFLWLSGTISVHVLVEQNREDHSMKFRQVKAGFMKKFEGCWKVEPIFVDEGACFPLKPRTLSDYNACTSGKGRIGSRVSLEQLLQPAIVPPPPFSWYLRGITTKTTEMLINDLVAETERIKGASVSVGAPEADVVISSEDANNLKLCDAQSIKERWAFRRRAARQNRRSA